MLRKARKTTTAFLLALTLLLSGALFTTAQAASTPDGDMVATIEGTAMKLRSGNLRVTGDGGAYTLLIGEQTVILDVRTMQPITLDKIKDGSTVYAYASKAMTFSLPPQTNAFYVLAHVSDSLALPSYETLQEKFPLADPKTATVWGSVQERSDTRLLLENSNPNDPLSPIWVGTSEDTIILDAVDGNPRAMKDIAEGDVVYAFILPVIAESYPPQGSAEMILCDIPADFAVPILHEIESVVATLEANGSVTLRTDRGALIEVDEGVELVAYMTDNIVTAGDLQAGRRILVWRGMDDKVAKIMVFM